MSNPITGDNSQFGSMFQKYIAGRLLRIDADAILGDNCRSCWWNFEFFGGKFEDSREGSILWHAKDFEGQLGVGGEDDFEGNFGARGGHGLDDESTVFRMPKSKQNRKRVKLRKLS